MECSSNVNSLFWGSCSPGVTTLEMAAKQSNRGSKSTTTEAQNELLMIAGTPPATNSWDSASTVVESQKSSASCNENDVFQTPKDQRIEKNCSTAQSSSSASSWNSTSNCKYYAERKSSESVCNMQKGVGSRVWFRFKNYKITLQ